MLIFQPIRSGNDVGNGRDSHAQQWYQLPTVCNANNTVPGIPSKELAGTVWFGDWTDTSFEAHIIGN